MKKFAIIYGSLKTAVQKQAVEELTKILLDYTLQYPVCLEYRKDLELSDYKCIYIGTPTTNPYVEAQSEHTLTKKESYRIRVQNSTVTIEGYDDAGVLYGVLDFYHKYVVKFEHPNTDKYWINFLEKDELPDFDLTSAPATEERGLWTWGHVIYDYKGYLDHMMQLKMNRVIIWNDFPPINAAEIVAYAHARNIKVIFGMPWLWDTDCNRFKLDELDGVSEEIFAKYEVEYAGVGADGIYFQTFTELNKDNINGILIADAAAKFVNRTASIFFEKYPHMEIQFGLHATSVKNRLEFIKTVDPRIRIVWENCGAFPFSYVPKETEKFEETKQFVQTIAHLRGKDDRFGVVTKGLVKLDWPTFEHLTGSHCLGVSANDTKQNRIENKKRIWRYIQACWLTNADKAYEMVREMRRLKDGNLCVFALVEDGMFEENVMYPVALYAEMLWDCDTDLKELTTSVALRRYVAFA